ncbi:DUF2029 domain-containing protein [bacterium]|nr:DUF2029 domain-containing protein [bacterium]
MSRQAKLWALWSLVVFGLFNFGLNHEARKETLASAQRTPLDWLRLARCYLTDDYDVQIYLAYCNASLGRAYPPALVRPFEDWVTTGFAQPVEEPEGWPVQPGGARLMPYRDFLVEYPPGLFLFAMPPALLSADLDVYRTLFSCLMGICLSLAVRLCQTDLQPADRERLLGWSLAMLLAIGMVSVRRFDGALSFLICASLWACRRGRPLLAGLCFGLAGATKIVPLILFPVLAQYLLRQRRRGELIRLFGMASVTVTLMFLPVAGCLGSLWAFHGGRPLQLESTAAAILGLFGKGSVVQTFGSCGLTGGYAAWARLVTTLALALALMGVWFLRRGVRLEEQTCQTLAWAMVLSPVFSPQYLLWILPLGCLVSILHSRRRCRVLLAVMLLTQLIWPISYDALQRQESWACLLVLARNGLLVYWIWLGRALTVDK